MEFNERTMKIIRLVKLKLGIDLSKSPCFSCETFKKDFPCNERECEILARWMSNLPKGR